jgi:hypothetical protein
MHSGLVILLGNKKDLVDVDEKTLKKYSYFAKINKLLFFQTR